MKHKHHIIPRHIGGTDDPFNLIELTIEEHAEAHRVLYETHGRWQDFLAWKGLLGVITEEERMKIMYAARRGIPGRNPKDFMTEEEIINWKAKLSKAAKGKKKPESWIKKHIERMTGETNPMFGRDPWNKGKKLGPQSPERRSSIGKGKIIFQGVEYGSMNEAVRETGISSYLISKEIRANSK